MWDGRDRQYWCGTGYGTGSNIVRLCRVMVVCTVWCTMWTCMDVYIILCWHTGYVLSNSQCWAIVKKWDRFLEYLHIVPAHSISSLQSTNIWITLSCLTEQLFSIPIWEYWRLSSQSRNVSTNVSAALDSKLISTCARLDISSNFPVITSLALEMNPVKHASECAGSCVLWLHL